MTIEPYWTVSEWAVRNKQRSLFTTNNLGQRGHADMKQEVVHVEVSPRHRNLPPNGEEKKQQRMWKEQDLRGPLTWKAYIHQQTSMTSFKLKQTMVLKVSAQKNNFNLIYRNVVYIAQFYTMIEFSQTHSECRRKFIKGCGWKYVYLLNYFKFERHNIDSTDVQIV